VQISNNREQRMRDKSKEQRAEEAGQIRKSEEQTAEGATSHQRNFTCVEAPSGDAMPWPSLPSPAPFW
jgi:hypothetical protein